MKSKLEIWTDGSCLKNPGGPGGWAWVDSDGVTAFGCSQSTTNNRMEMTAVLNALRSCASEAQPKVFSDSQYVVKGLTIWHKGWKKKGWRKQGMDMPNRDLWVALDAEVQRVKPKMTWVRGHSGNPGNELADMLAGSAARSQTSSDGTTKTSDLANMPAPKVEPTPPKVEATLWKEIKSLPSGEDLVITYAMPEALIRKAQEAGLIGEVLRA